MPVARLEPRDHTISLAVAAEYTRRHRTAGSPGGTMEAAKAGAKEPNGASFHADQVLKLLQQPGCSGLRIYYGRDSKGEKAMVLVGVNAEGKDMTSGIMMELGLPCPPFCDPDSALIA